MAGRLSYLKKVIDEDYTNCLLYLVAKEHDDGADKTISRIGVIRVHDGFARSE